MPSLPPKPLQETTDQDEGVHLRVLLEGLVDAVLLIDEGGAIHAVGSGVQALFGFTPSQLIGADLGRLLVPGEHERVLERLERLGTQSFTASDETGSSLMRQLRMEVTARRSDDSSFRAELFLHRVDLACGRSGLHYVGTLHDLSDRQEAEAALAASERRLRALFNQEFQFIGLMRPDGTLIEVNQPVLDLAGTTRAEQLGRFLWDTVWWSHSSQLQDDVRGWTERAARGEFVRNEVEILGQDGRLSTVDFSIKPLRDDDGQIELLIPEGRDITELVRARRRETAMLESLAEIGESASILAHEVKNPITALNLALRAVSGGLGADERALIEELVTRMQRLERQIRRTLSFTKPVELDLSRCDLELLVDDVLAELRPELDAAGIELAVDFPSADTTLMADEQLLRQVVTNLLRNALEALTRADGAASPEPHRPSGQSRVLVCLHRLEPEGSLELAIHDSGPGVPADMREDLFRPYFTTKARGTGLGLALCRKIVREHGGSIELDVSRLGGARFLVRLPGGSA